MKTVNIQEAKTHLSRLVEEVGAGEEVVIAKAGKPLVKLVPVSALAGPRRLGRLAGKIRESADCWALDPATEAAFYDGEIEPIAPSRVTRRPPGKPRARK